MLASVLFFWRDVMEFSIRVSRDADIPAIDALFAKSYPRLLKPDYPPSILVTAVPLISKAQPALVRSGTFYVAETAGGHVVGAGGWTRQGPRGGVQEGTVHIRHFATDPDCVRVGIGSALMERCLADANATGAVHVSCYSTRTAVPFYEAVGFRQIGTMDIELRPGIRFPAIWTERSLP